MASGPAVMIGANLRLGSGGLGSQNVSVSSSPAFQCHPGGTTEAAIIFCLGSLGMAANFALMVLILTKRQLRRWSQGLLFHQAVVDGCRAAILLPLGISIYYCQPVQKCSLVETAFLLLVTVSTVNMLTTVLNDSPVFPNDEDDETDLTAPLLMDSPQCVLFGVFMIWFASITINLGPTFLSGALAANSEAGHNAPSCPLVHGPLRHYVLNLLWIIINVICVGLTLFHLHKLHRDLTKANVEAVRVAGLVTTLVSVTGGGGGLGGGLGGSSGPPGGAPRPVGALDEHRRMRNYLKRMEREGVQRVKMFLVITGAYVLFWGPLFFVTLVHHPLIVSPMGYEITLHVAYVHAFVNPTLFLVLHRGLRGAALDVCCGCCLFLADWILGAAGVDRPPHYAPHRSRRRRHSRTLRPLRPLHHPDDRPSPSPTGSADLPPPPHPPTSSVSEISLLKQKSSSTTDVGVMTQPIVPIDHPILTQAQLPQQTLRDENLMYGQTPWGRSVDGGLHMDSEAVATLGGQVRGAGGAGLGSRSTARVGPMVGQTSSPGPVPNHGGSTVSPGRYMTRKDYEDDEDDSAACSSVSD